MGREKQDFNTRSPDSPVQFPRGAQFHFLRIDLDAGEWGYRPEISRQLDCGLGEEKLASREVKYVRARVCLAVLAWPHGQPASRGDFPSFLSLPFSIESGRFGLVKAG